jgi:hypothetical protein
MNRLDLEIRALVEHDFKSRRIDPYVTVQEEAPQVPLEEAPAGLMGEDAWRAAAARQKRMRADAEKKLGKAIKTVHHDKLKVGDRIHYGVSVMTIKKVEKGEYGRRITLSGTGGTNIVTELGLDANYLGIVEDVDALDEAQDLSGHGETAMQEIAKATGLKLHKAPASRRDRNSWVYGKVGKMHVTVGYDIEDGVVDALIEDDKKRSLFNTQVELKPGAGRRVAKWIQTKTSHTRAHDESVEPLEEGARPTATEIVQKAHFFLKTAVKPGYGPSYMKMVIKDLGHIVRGNGDASVAKNYPGWEKLDFQKLIKSLDPKGQYESVEGAPRTGVGKLLSSMLSETDEVEDFEGQNDLLSEIVIDEDWDCDVELLEFRVPGPDEVEAKRRARIYMSKDIQPTYHKAPKGLYILTWQENGRFYGIAFRGKAEKPMWYHTFRSEEDSKKRVKATVMGYQAVMSRKAKEAKEKADFAHSYVAGDILYSSWGYDQTNVDWYQVVKTTAKSISVRKLAAKVVPHGRGSDHSSPIKGKFVGKATGMKRVRVASDGKGSIKVGHTSAYGWDGRPKHQTDAYSGH